MRISFVVKENEEDKQACVRALRKMDIFLTEKLARFFVNGSRGQSGMEFYFPNNDEIEFADLRELEQHCEKIEVDPFFPEKGLMIKVRKGENKQDAQV